jgi:hypothetical protein
MNIEQPWIVDEFGVGMAIVIVSGLFVYMVDRLRAQIQRQNELSSADITNPAGNLCREPAASREDRDHPPETMRS